MCIYSWNNPLKYTDPDGNNPVLAAALLGGFINLGIQILSGNVNTWQDAGLAFGVGFLAGALGAGIGSAISNVVATGGGFGVGLTGQAVVTPMGFGAGFLSGASGGFASGFVGGAGNTLINDGTPKEALNAGINAGIAGILTGGILGGIGGGMYANQHNNNFWTGKPPLYDYELERYELVLQNTPLNCKNATCESIEKLRGGTRDQNYFKGKGEAFLENNPNASYEDYYNAMGFETYDASNLSIEQIGKGMRLGNPTVINEKISNLQNHTLTVTRVRQWNVGGNTRVWFADPARGTWSATWEATAGNPEFNKASTIFILRR